MQRTKGAAYEREVAKLFSGALGVIAKRRLGQAREGGHDIDMPDLPLVIECKRRKRPLLALRWLEQAQEAAEHPRQTPLVVTRGDDSPNLVVLYADDFLSLMRKVLAWEMTQ